MSRTTSEIAKKKLEDIVIRCFAEGRIEWLSDGKTYLLIVEVRSESYSEFSLKEVSFEELASFGCEKGCHKDISAEQMQQRENQIRGQAIWCLLTDDDFFFSNVIEVAILPNRKRAKA